MSAPVRMVCGGCLRSVEIEPGGGQITDNLCPNCGGVIDSSADRTRPRTGMTQIPDELFEVVPRGEESSTGWTETWSRGSLGSLGRFQLRERLGDGGFGQVFLAYDPRLDRDVALKILKQANPTERVMERFFREARAAARLDHPNIVAVHDAGFDGGRCWVAFHFVSGRPLNWYRDHHRLDAPTAAKILRDLADAVDHGHRQGVLHRDLKPANVLIDDLGRPRLIDFGLARRSDLDSSLTRDGAVVGTPAYMSPEQALGQSRQADERSDVFSLGVIFFEALCGQRPYGAASQGEAANDASPNSATAVKPMPCPSARAVNPSVPLALDQICMRAIARDREARYPSARALADDLDCWLLAHRGGRARKSRIASTMLLGLAACLLLAIGFGAAFVPWSGRQVPGMVQALLSPSTSPEPAQPDAGRATARVPDASAPEPARTPRTEAPASKKAVLIGSKNTKHFHAPRCSYIDKINIPNRIEFASEAEALASGLTPCGYCLGARGQKEPRAR